MDGKSKFYVVFGRCERESRHKNLDGFHFPPKFPWKTNLLVSYIYIVHSIFISLLIFFHSNATRKIRGLPFSPCCLDCVKNIRDRKNLQLKRGFKSGEKTKRLNFWMWDPLRLCLFFSLSPLRILSYFQWLLGTI